MTFATFATRIGAQVFLVCLSYSSSGIHAQAKDGPEFWSQFATAESGQGFPPRMHQAALQTRRFSKLSDYAQQRIRTNTVSVSTTMFS